MNYENDFKQIISAVEFENGINRPLLKGFIEYFKEMEEGIEYFYPKGMMTGRDLTLMFFYKDKMRIVNFDKENNTFRISTYFDKISNVELTVKPMSDSKRRLHIYFESKEEMILDSINDADPTREWQYAETIEKLYRYLA